jgi:hypothetical protein
MSCCGDKRAAARTAAPARSSGSPSAPGPRPSWAAGPTAFVYDGPGRLVVTGPLTGIQYTFAGPGARASVHGADAPSLATVPGLKPAR